MKTAGIDTSTAKSDDNPGVHRSRTGPGRDDESVDNADQRVSRRGGARIRSAPVHARSGGRRKEVGEEEGGSGRPGPGRDVKRRYLVLYSPPNPRLAEVDAAIGTAVNGLREYGYSWTEIGNRLGISRQAARQRWNGRR